MPDLPARYEPSAVEPRVFERRMTSGLHHPEPEGDAAENYSVAIPPPNVTGALHMGHALHGRLGPGSRSRAPEGRVAAPAKAPTSATSRSPASSTAGPTLAELPASARPRSS